MAPIVDLSLQWVMFGGQAAKLSFLAHALMESRSGLVLDIPVTGVARLCHGVAIHREPSVQRVGNAIADHNPSRIPRAEPPAPQTCCGVEPSPC